MDTLLKMLLVMGSAWAAVAACLGLMFGRWMNLQKEVSDQEGRMEHVQ